MTSPDSSADVDVPDRRADVEWVELDGEAVLYDPQSHVVHRLNAGAASVWAACDGTASQRRIARDLEKTYSGPPGVITRDVRTVIRRLRRLGLLRRSPAEAEPQRGDDSPR
jgi:Coenzyme PQQ synthesis protein D (PqqD)